MSQVNYPLVLLRLWILILCVHKELMATNQRHSLQVIYLFIIYSFESFGRVVRSMKNVTHITHNFIFQIYLGSINRMQVCRNEVAQLLSMNENCAYLKTCMCKCLFILKLNGIGWLRWMRHCYWVYLLSLFSSCLVTYCFVLFVGRKFEDHPDLKNSTSLISRD